MVWTPSTADPEIASEIPNEILKILIWLRNPSDDSMTIKDPKIIYLADILFSYITNKRTKFHVKFFYIHWFKFVWKSSKIYWNVVI